MLLLPLLLRDGRSLRHALQPSLLSVLLLLRWWRLIVELLLGVLGGRPLLVHQLLLLWSLRECGRARGVPLLRAGHRTVLLLLRRRLIVELLLRVLGGRLLLVHLLLLLLWLLSICGCMRGVQLLHAGRHSRSARCLGEVGARMLQKRLLRLLLALRPCGGRDHGKAGCICVLWMLCLLRGVSSHLRLLHHLPV
jgi:hypothetical protein